jgi:hypothetical protein
VTEKANPHIVTLHETQNKSSGTVNATELPLLRAPACIKLMSTNLMKYGTLAGTTAEVNKISDEKDK